MPKKKEFKFLVKFFILFSSTSPHSTFSENYLFSTKHSRQTDRASMDPNWKRLGGQRILFHAQL